MVYITATRDQIIAISHLPAVRSIYGNRTLNLTSEPEVRAFTGVDRAQRDAEITSHNGNLASYRAQCNRGRARYRNRRDPWGSDEPRNAEHQTGRHTERWCWF